MRPFRSAAQAGERTNAVNMAVKVEAYVENSGVVSVKGKRLETGIEVVVALTNRGELASHAKRPPLSNFRDKKNNLGVEIGGVIGFDRCYPNGTEGFFNAGWPTYLAGDGSEAELRRLKVNRQATLRIREHNGRLFGTVSVWQPENVNEFSTLENLEKATAKWMNDVATKIANSHGSAIMRARNSAGEVVAYADVYARYIKSDGKHETGEKAIENFKTTRNYQTFIAEAEAGRAVMWDIVPAVNLDLSMKSLEENGNSLRATEKAYQKDGELFSKGTTFVMDPNHKLVIKVMVHDPFGDSGIDPVLFAKGGKFVNYNAAFKALLSGEQPSPVSNDAAQEPVAAAETGPAIDL